MIVEYKGTDNAVWNFLDGSFDIREYEAPISDLNAETITFVSITILYIVAHIPPYTYAVNVFLTICLR